MINHILLTKHSINRGYDRLSANSDELSINVNQAYTNGNRKSDFKGKFRKYLDTKSKEYPLNTLRIHNGIIWVFSNDLGMVHNSLPIKYLITFYPVPKRYKWLDTYKNIKYD
jgi:hypothetical protein